MEPARVPDFDPAIARPVVAGTVVGWGPAIKIALPDPMLAVFDRFQLAFSIHLLRVGNSSTSPVRYSSTLKNPETPQHKRQRPTTTRGRALMLFVLLGVRGCLPTPLLPALAYPIPYLLR